MPVHLGWQAIAIRLLLTVIAGTIIGINRDERGLPVGLRTTLLVSLAAAIAMIQANLLMGTAGRHPDSFIMLDLMRLPLGILSGIGFIGAGAILKRGDAVHGVTTAATLWFVTVMGLCFGGGQLGLGTAALALGILTLWTLKGMEKWVRQYHRATLILKFGQEAPSEDAIRSLIENAGCRPISWDVLYGGQDRLARLQCELRWRARRDELALPPALNRVSEFPGLLQMRIRR